MSFQKHRMIKKRDELIKRPKIITDQGEYPMTKLPLKNRLYRVYQSVSNIKVLKNTGIIKFDQAKSEESKAENAKIGDQFGESWTTHWFFIDFTIPDEWDKLAAKEDEYHLIWDSGSEASIYDYETGEYLQAFSVPTRNFYVLNRNGSKHLKFAIEMACNAVMGNFEGGNHAPVDMHMMFTLSKCQIGLLRKNMHDLKVDFDTLFDVANLMNDPNYQYGEQAYGIIHQMSDILVTTDDQTDEEVSQAREIAQKYLSVHHHDLAHQLHAVGH